MKPILTAFVILLSVQAYAQSNGDKLSYFNEDWKSAKAKSAAYMLCERQINDTCYQSIYYNNYGPRLRFESYKDEKKTIRHGKYAHYYPNGTIDSSGSYSEGKQNGLWIYRSRDGKSFHRKNWQKGILISDSTLTLSDTPKSKELKPGEIESEYPGGVVAWQHYLNKNLRYPPRAIDHEVMGEIRIQFIVDKDGNVYEPDVVKSVEYSLDEESLLIIVQSGKWTPAVQDGKIVRSYKIQPIVYKLEVDNGRRK